MVYGFFQLWFPSTGAHADAFRHTICTLRFALHPPPRKIQRKTARIVVSLNSATKNKQPTKRPITDLIYSSTSQAKDVPEAGDVWAGVSQGAGLFVHPLASLELYEVSRVLAFWALRFVRATFVRATGRPRKSAA